MIRFLSFLILTLLSLSVSFAQSPVLVAPTTATQTVRIDDKNTKAATGSVLLTKPQWHEIKPAQQIALMPLQSEWPKLSDIQKRKWLEISNSFGKLSPEEQVKLHSRMKEWIVLSPQQRTQARLNFSTAKTLSPEERQKQWQAYQSLSPVERQKLQTNAIANVPNSAALANKPQKNTAPTSKMQLAIVPSSTIIKQE